MQLDLLDENTTLEVYTVSRLTREVRGLLEESYPSLWIRGELSNVSCPSSGHIYFSLRDENSQVSAAFFRNHHRKLDFIPKDGQTVLIKARVSLYESRGNFQLIVESMEELGAGLLLKRFEALKKRLAQEGLFNIEHKKPIPDFAATVGVITSPTGAVIRDILTTLKRRFPQITVVIYPTAVQGEQATPQIVEAIGRANARREVDVLILARGGGSMEDLWCFNEESVARAIFASELPLISAIGHETDITLADFVADKRAPTPTAAAEFVSPDGPALQQQLLQSIQRLHRCMQRTLQQAAQRIDYLTKCISNPQLYLQQQRQQLHYLRQAMVQHMHRGLLQQQNQLEKLQMSLLRCNPTHRIAQQLAQLHAYQQSMIHAMQHHLQYLRQQLGHHAASLDALSPLATLKRGYAIVTHQKTKQLICSRQQVAIGDVLRTELAEGWIESKVIHK